MDLYREDILEHYRHPQNFGELPDATNSAKSYNPSCGDEMVMQVKVEGGRVVDLRFKGESCAISRAGASMLTEEVKGKTLDEIRAVTDGEHLARFGKELAPGRLKCAMLSLGTLRQALKTGAKE
jgi:nitrogen fixation NifU-like protein